jgi:hypothetical protein
MLRSIGASLFFVIFGVSVYNPQVYSQDMQSYYIKHDFSPDADVNKKVWNKALASQQIIRDWKGDRLYPTQKSEVKSLWSKDYLYFLFITNFDDLTVDALLEEKNRPICSLDIIELFIGNNPDINKYYEFHVSPLGQKADMFQSLAQPRIFDPNWNSGWDVAVKIDKTAKVWISEIRIPFKAISTNKVFEGGTFNFNAFRCSGSHSQKNRIYMAMNPTETETPNFHVPDKFGKLILTSPRKISSVNPKKAKASYFVESALNLKAVRVDVMDRIFPDIEPNPLIYQKPIAVPKGACASFQFAVKANKTAICEVKLSKIIAEDNSPFKGKCSIYQILPVHVEGNTDKCSNTYPYPNEPPEKIVSYLVRKAPFDVLEVLTETDKLELYPGIYQGVLIDISVLPDTKPGTYSTNAIFEVEDVYKNVPFSFRVFKTAIKEYDLNVSIRLDPKPKHLSSNPAPKYWSDEHFRQLEQAGRQLHANGDNIVKTPLFSVYDLKVPLIDVIYTRDNTYDFDFTKFDRWVDMFLSLGYDYIAGDHMNLSRSGIKPMPVYAYDKKTSGKINIFNATSDVNEWMEFVNIFYAKLYSHLKKKGWLKHYMQHLSDEHLDKLSYDELLNQLHTFMPGVKAVDASNHSDQNPDIKIWRPEVIVRPENLPVRAKLKKRGIIQWIYHCCGPLPPYPNRQLDRSLANSRVYPWLAYMLDCEGYLFWAANRYRGVNPYERSIGPTGEGVVEYPGHPPGDNWMYYPGPEGLRSSVRQVVFRDGLVDHTLLMMLAKTDKKKADEIMKIILRSATDYGETPECYHIAREELLKALDQNLN